MKKEYYYQQLKEMILKRFLGDVFMIKDINLNMPYENIKKYLQRLEKQGCIKRAIRGVYYVPVYSETLKRYCRPNYEQVIQALARTNKWTILPNQQSILNSIGLDTQISNRIEYITSGPNKKYNVFGLNITLQHSCDNFIFNCSFPTMVFVQAINAISLSRLTKKDIEKINFYFSDNDKKIIRDEIKFYKKPYIKITELFTY